MNMRLPHRITLYFMDVTYVQVIAPMLAKVIVPGSAKEIALVFVRLIVKVGAKVGVKMNLCRDVKIIIL